MAKKWAVLIAASLLISAQQQQQQPNLGQRGIIREGRAGAVNRDSNDSLARSHLAPAYRMAGAYDRAIEEGRAALKIDPNNAQALLWLADSLRAQKQHADARDAYRDYVRLTNFDSTPA